MRLKVEAQIRAFPKRLNIFEFQISGPAFSSSAVHNTTHKTKPRKSNSFGSCRVVERTKDIATLENTSLAAPH